MKKLFFIALLLMVKLAHADCTSPPFTISSSPSIICHASAMTFGTVGGSGGGLGGSYQQVTTSPTATEGIVMGGYACFDAGQATCTTPANWVASHSYTSCPSTGSALTTCTMYPTVGNPCNTIFYATTGGTSGSSEPTWSTTGNCQSTATISDSSVVWTPIRLVIFDNVNNPETCFQLSPNSPFALQSGVVYLNYLWYCPSVPSGVTVFTVETNIQLGSNVGPASFTTMLYNEYTGLCTTGTCIDRDGFANCSSCTSLTVNMSSAARYTNEMLLYLGGSQNDEALTATTCLITQMTSGNMLSAVFNAAGGIHSCGQTWSPADLAGAALMTIKTPSSVAIASNFAIPVVY